MSSASSPPSDSQPCSVNKKHNNNRQRKRRQRKQRGALGHALSPNTPGKNQFDSYSVTQINLKRKYNAWGTLLANTHGRKNPIILATEPYTNNKNVIPRINKDFTQYYYNKGDV